MRRFKGLIFFGNIEAIESSKALHHRLEEALVISSGLQQPPHSTSEREAKACAEQTSILRDELLDIVRDIAAAVVGRDIIFGGTLPYPPEPPEVD